MQVNILEAPRTVDRFRVKAVPAVFWIRDGNVVEYTGGADALKVCFYGENFST
jgi:thioredoxin-like negative regulator of GroEL